MKTMKLALLGGAALAMSAVAAQAEDLSALKVEIEALNARLQQLEAAPAVPAGYSLMTMSTQQRTVVPGNEEGEDKGIGDTAHVIGIMPTADAAPSTTIEWSGYVYAMVRSTAYQDGDEADTYIGTRGHLRVVGKTDTAVGEVGARINLRAGDWYGSIDSDPSFISNEYWGWWAMTPELTLGGGFSGSLGNIGYGVDGACNCWGTDFFSADFRTGSHEWPLGAMNPGDAHQVRMSYGSGPLSFAVAVEGSGWDDGDDDAQLAFAAEMKFAGDTFNGEISAISWGGSDYSGWGNGPGYQIGGGVGFGLGDMANVSLGAAIGQQERHDEYYVLSGLVNFNMSDAVHAEIGASYGKFHDAFWVDQRHEVLTVLAGAYYSPVSQLTIGVEGQWADGGEPHDPWTDAFTTFDIVTIYSF